MDSQKLETRPDVTSGLEKGCQCRVQSWDSETETCHAASDSIRSARSFDRTSFLKGCTMALGTMALACLFLSDGRQPLGWPRYTTFSSEVDTGYPTPEDGQIQQCIDGANWTRYHHHPDWSVEHPYGAETSFSLPLDADAQYLLSRGAYQLGLVEIDQSTEVTDTVDVRVRVAYYTDTALDRATVCKMIRADNEYGVGVFTPKNARRYLPQDQLRFDVTLTLPAGNEAPLVVKQLDTLLPNYSQRVGDLSETVSFDNVSLKSLNGYIMVESITSEVGEFSSFNGVISGQFNARSSLTLDNKNGRIASTVNLLNREGATSSKLSIHTLNGELDADIALASESGTGGIFEVDAQTNNGKLGLQFIDSPLDSVLKCQAQTLVGRLEVQLNSAFEGTYSMRSTLGPKAVEEHRVEDPANRGRHRSVSLSRSGRYIEGEVKWVESDGSSSQTEGSVTLSSTLGSSKLVI